MHSAIGLENFLIGSAAVSAPRPIIPFGKDVQRVRGVYPICMDAEGTAVRWGPVTVRAKKSALPNLKRIEFEVENVASTGGTLAQLVARYKAPLRQCGQ